MTDQLQPLRDALASKPKLTRGDANANLDALRAHRDWLQDVAEAATPQLLQDLLARLDAAEADARRWRHGHENGFMFAKLPHNDCPDAEWLAIEDIDAALTQGA